MIDERYHSRKEVQEAVVAGTEALGALERAKECLNSAGNWGIVDILGGGLISTFVKHSKMGDASRLVEKARSTLKQFQKELQDVQSLEEIQIETGDFLAFADYFFDGAIADWLMQSRIKKAKRQVEEAIEKVEKILEQLRRL